MVLNVFDFSVLGKVASPVGSLVRVFAWGCLPVALCTLSSLACVMHACLVSDSCIALDFSFHP